jgi:hypothetical protein
MTSHELARKLLAGDDKPVNISLDISTCDEDAHMRAFSNNFTEMVTTDGEVMLCFTGYINEG